MSDFTWRVVIYSIIASSYATWMMWRINEKHIHTNQSRLVVAIAALIISASILMFFSIPLARLYLLGVVLLGYLALILLLLFKCCKTKKDSNAFRQESNINITKMSAITSIICIFILIISGSLNHNISLLLDGLCVLTRQYQTIEAQADSYNSFLVKRDENESLYFQISSRDFKQLKEDNVYTVIYLPHSEYVVDILNENGKSLLK